MKFVGTTKTACQFKNQCFLTYLLKITTKTIRYKNNKEGVIFLKQSFLGSKWLMTIHSRNMDRNLGNQTDIFIHKTNTSVMSEWAQ